MKTKQITAMVLTIIMVFSLVPVFSITAGAANPRSGDFEYKLLPVGVEITKYVGNGGKVGIPGKINGEPVINIGADAFSEYSSGEHIITSVAIPNSVTSIGDRAFINCTSLTSVTIPNSVTSIGKDAFEDCESLTSVIIPNSVTSIGDDAFGNCESLTSVTIPNSVTSIGRSAFINCTSLTSVVIPNSVTIIGGWVFRSCENLASVTIPHSVTSIGDYAFEGCESLTSVVIPKSVTSIDDGAFRNCTSLTSVIIPNSVTSIGDDAFRNCKSLTSVTIPNSVTEIGGDQWGNHAFYDCPALTIYGAKGSVAESFAKERNIRFKVSSTPVAAKPLPAPASVKSAVNGAKVTLSWNAVAGAEKYGVYILKPGTTKYVSLGTTAKTSVTIPSLKSVTQYKFKIVAVDVTNGKSTIGTPSAAVIVKTR